LTSVPKINVPLFRQPHPDYCVPACIKMVIDYLRQVYGDEEIPNLPISKIAKQIKTDTKNGGQTTIDNVPLINNLLNTRNFHIRFSPKYPCDWKTVIQENENGKPVIAWIWNSDKNNQAIGTGHSVVITDVDREKGMVAFNDPAIGLRKTDTITFISQWENENVDKTLILLEIDKILPTEKAKQKILPEYIEEVVKIECRTNN
jgi:hypothetical protein